MASRTSHPPTQPVTAIYFWQAVTPMALISALRRRYVAGSNPQADGQHRPHAFRWQELGRAARRHFKHSPGVNCMLGPMSAVAKVRRQPGQPRPQPQSGMEPP